jgi:hypothetical protein
MEQSEGRLKEQFQRILSTLQQVQPVQEQVISMKRDASISALCANTITGQIVLWHHIGVSGLSCAVPFQPQAPHWSEWSVLCCAISAPTSVR